VKRKKGRKKVEKSGAFGLAGIKKSSKKILKIIKKANKYYAVIIGIVMLTAILITSALLTTRQEFTKGRAEAGGQRPVFESISPNQGSGSHQIFTTTVSDPNGANTIAEIDIWFDIQPPMSARTSYSFHSALLNKNGQWKYYGWQYIGDRYTCEDGKTGTACWMNYEISVGGFVPADNDSMKIYCGGDYSDGTVDSSSRTGEWKVRNVTVSGNTITITWDLKFKQNFPFDYVDIYVHAHDLSGLWHHPSEFWERRGVWGTRDAIPPNHPPVITSTPPSRVKVGQLYRYEILATDPDGDALTYRSSTPLPSWLSLSGNILSGTPSDKDIGVYNIVIVVQDGHGHNVPQAFTLTVYKPATPPPPPPRPPQPQNDYPSVTISVPTASTIFRGKDNIIVWEASDSNGISKVDLYYSENGQDWKEIAKDLPGNTTQYQWDVSSLPSGGYFVKVEVFDNSPDHLSGNAISPEFQIDNEPKGDNKPVIRTVQPGDHEIVEDTTPTIGATYTSGDVAIDLNSVRLLVDGKQVEATVLETNVSYTPKEPMAAGNHDVSLTVKNVNGDTASRSWSFTIAAKISPQQPTVESKDVIKLPIIGSVSKPVGIMLITCFTIILLASFVFATIRLISVLKKPEESIELPQYYEETPPYESLPMPEGEMPPPEASQTPQTQPNILPQTQEEQYQTPQQETRVPIADLQQQTGTPQTQIPPEQFEEAVPQQQSDQPQQQWQQERKPSLGDITDSQPPL